MIKLCDLTYYSHRDFNEPSPALALHKASLGYTDFIKDKMNVEVIMHLNYEGSAVINQVKYSFFKSINKFYYIPFKTHRHLKKEKPDVLLVQGLIFPLQVIFLRMALGRNCKLLLMHHGERPFKGIKNVIQKIADKFIDGYLFTSSGNAEEWVKQKIFSANKCHEVIGASTYLTKQNKQQSKEKLGITGDNIFLWVGRLEKNKDPITILKGFSKYLTIDENAKLYMIFQKVDMLLEVETLIHNSEALKKSVHLVGKIDHEELEYWFSAADYYLSGSHREGSGYALVESMACGCIPVVTNIPSFKKITGQHGFLFEPGDPDSLFKALQRSSEIAKDKKSLEIVNYFNASLSYKKIAEDIFRIYEELTLNYSDIE